MAYADLLAHMGTGLGRVPELEKLDALEVAAERLCREAEAYRTTQAIACVSGTLSYALSAVAGARMERVLRLLDGNGEELPVQYWAWEPTDAGDVVTLETAAVVDGVSYTAELLLVPELGEELPAHIQSRYARDLVLGARATLRVQDGAPWADLQLGPYLEQRFVNRMNEIKGLARTGYRGQSGGIRL